MLAKQGFFPVTGFCIAFLILLQACAGASRDAINIDRTSHVSVNYDQRIKYVVIHYTSENFAESVRLLTTRTDYPVSSHYLVAREKDSVTGSSEAPIYQLVPDAQRAWHAGRSYWNGDTDLNYTSIGIEIVNESGCDAPIMELKNTPAFSTSCQFKPFTDRQIEAVSDLLEDLVQRYPDLKPIDIVGHSDIAPLRKVDPGPFFPWKKLYDEGYGSWFDTVDYDRYLQQFSKTLPSITALQSALAKLGYQIEVTGQEDMQSQIVVRAFQMRYVQTHYTGRFDADTAARLYALVSKYRSR
ncbi:MAG TPA: N-acetylmuramoyl-L-alanine amidase [Gammaproteobacteria bacterium]|nr:N-acetylmuramoyl-L-alanine amidase [Gammaproteobacteria bacterium]|tara:strand:+ start:87 stop:980 length:894 start_codon:yes stop_codon:yes gene_type:complete